MTPIGCLARLYLFAFNFNREWRHDEKWLADLFATLRKARIGCAQFKLRTPRSSRWSRALEEVTVQEKLLRGKEGSYTLESTSVEKAVITFQDYGHRISLKVDCALGLQGGPGLQSILVLAAGLNAAMKGRGLIGPTYYLALPKISYPRPRPPLYSPRYEPGVLAYFMSRAYAQSGDKAIEIGAFDKLTSTPLPKDLTREMQGDLLVVRGPADLTDLEATRQSLSSMEVWLGNTLDFALDDDFKPNGDKARWVVRSERGHPFSLYDPAARVAYEILGEAGRGDLDPATVDVLRALLPQRSLPDGQPIVATMTVFPNREAALRNLDKVRSLGGAGVLYEEEARWWDPDPPGEWLHG